MLDLKKVNKMKSYWKCTEVKATGELIFACDNLLVRIDTFIPPDFYLLHL